MYLEMRALSVIVNKHVKDISEFVWLFDTFIEKMTSGVALE